jgi:hypothetical protein
VSGGDNENNNFYDEYYEEYDTYDELENAG